MTGKWKFKSSSVNYSRDFILLFVTDYGERVNGSVLPSPDVEYINEILESNIYLLMCTKDRFQNKFIHIVIS